ncbi:DUF2269 family protein [Planosporangium sp. 12N6]|uniref:DUF2269 family protein n=1 Tax=Planosporangium spinosum TaxID=3402278 RepID=UPI003CEB73B0
MSTRWSRRSRYLLLVLHYVTSVGWLGVGICQLTLNLMALTTGEPLLRHHVHEIAHVLDRWVFPPLAVGAAVTGVLLSWRSRWGLLRYWWIVVKLVLTVALIVALPVWLGDRVNEAITATAPADPGADYPAVRAELLAGSVGVLTTLVLIVIVSVVKPWGRTPRPGPIRASRTGMKWPRNAGSARPLGPSDDRPLSPSTQPR